jgi:hypothetical protein
MRNELQALQTELLDILADLRRTEAKVRGALTTLGSEVSQRAVAGSSSVFPLEKELRGPVQSTRGPTRSAASLATQRASKAAEGSEFNEFGSAPRTARSDTDDIECGKTYYRKNYDTSGEKIMVNKIVRTGVYEITSIEQDGKRVSKRMTIGALRPILGDIVREKYESQLLADAQRWPRTLHVHLLAGGTVSVIVTQDDTILDVKKSIETKQGIPVREQIIIVDGTVLRDSEFCIERVGQGDQTFFLQVNDFSENDYHASKQSLSRETELTNVRTGHADMLRNLAAAQDAISEKRESDMRTVRRIQQGAPATMR